MSVVVFTGPTICADAVHRVLPNADVRGPAARGDVYRAAHQGATMIGIIDGYFRRVPSIWHKEILWALSQGVRVLGSASMGAIRAAEMAAFGMEGVGEIYRAFANGEVDDDEVAVLHGTAECGFRAMSTALADIRATLRFASQAGITDTATTDLLLSIAKSTYYPDRSYVNLLADARCAHLGPDLLGTLTAWIATNRVEQKRCDARAMLECMRPRCTSAVVGEDRNAMAAKRPEFVPTSSFARLRQEETCATSVHDGRDVPTNVLDELRLDADLWPSLQARARQRGAEITLAESLGAVVDQAAVDRASDDIRQRLGLFEPAMFGEWLSANDLSFADYAHLVRRDALRRDGNRYPKTQDVDLLDQIRIDGLYPTLKHRADQKARTLAEAGVSGSGDVPNGPTAAEVLAWIDDRQPAAGDCFPDHDDRVRAARREYQFAVRQVPEPERRSVFATSVWTTDFGHDALSDDLKCLALDLEANTPGRMLSNAGGWQSEALDLGEPLVQRAYDRFLRPITNVLGHGNVQLSTPWLNVNRYKDHNSPHHHVSAVIAGVYYVDAVPATGRLCFLDGNTARSSNVRTQDPEATDWIAPHTGRLVLFPGWVWHYVTANMTTDARISMAFNVHLGGSAIS